MEKAKNMVQRKKYHQLTEFEMMRIHDKEIQNLIRE